jgi:hypothetical protein
MRLLITRHAAGLALASLLAITLGSAPAEADWYKYTITAEINDITTNATSLAKMNAANMGLGAQVVTEAIFDTESPDQNPEPNFGSYPAYVKITIGDGPTVYVAEAMRRDNDGLVGLENEELAPPFILDAWGWFGTNPKFESGPSFLAWNSQLFPESKGMAAGIAAFSPSVTLTNTDLPLGGCVPSGTPCFWNLGEFISQTILANLIDVEQGNATIDIEANQNVTLSIETTTPVEIPGVDVPSLDGVGLFVLCSVLLAAGGALARPRPGVAAA